MKPRFDQPDPVVPERGHRRTAAIMVSFDGSSPSLHALAWGAGEAARTGKRLVALHVIPTTSLASITALALAPDYCVEVDTEQSDDDIAGLVDRAARDLDIPIEFLTTRGKYTRELLRAARESQADMVVVGRPTGSLPHFLGFPIRRLAATHDAPIVVIVP